MNDLISRQDAIDAIECICNTPCNEYFVNAINRLPSAQKWIPISERLPEYKQEIFFTEKNNETGELYVGRGQFWGLTARTGSGNNPWYYVDTFGIDGRRWHVLDSKIVAWLPAPRPWEGEE